MKNNDGVIFFVFLQKKIWQKFILRLSNFCSS